MKVGIFQEKKYDLLLINNKSISYFRLEKSGKVLKAETLEINLFSQEIFQRENLEKGISALIQKHKLTVLGIILNLPNILYQRITLPRSSNPYEAIVNYLKVSLPLSLEKYTFFYKEDKYQLAPTISNFNIIFIAKDIIDQLLRVINKYNIIPLFIAPSIEAIYQYLVAKPLIQFNEDYIIFFIQKKAMISLLIKNLRIEKVLIEEIDLTKTDLNLLVNRFYNFLKTNIGPEGKVYFFSDQELPVSFPEISHQHTVFSLKPIEILLEGANLIFNKVFTDQEFVDFLPLKPYSAYFLNRLPSIIIFLSVYLLAVFLIVSGIFLTFNLKFKNDIKSLSEEIKKAQTVQNQAGSQINQLLDLSKNFTPQILENFDKIKKAVVFENFESLTLENFSKIKFSLKVGKDDLEEIKFQISQAFPGINLIQEETISENEVRLIYSF